MSIVLYIFLADLFLTVEDEDHASYADNIIVRPL